MTLPRLRHARIGTKVTAAMLLAVGSLFTLFVIITSLWNREQAEADAVANVTERSALLRTTVEVLDQSLREQVATYANVFKNGLSGTFAVEPETMVMVAGRNVPTLTLAGKALNLDFAIPDSFTDLTGAYATVFVRDGDDFVRITTSHKKEDGARAIGTVLDHSHPAYQLLLQGGSYKGSASLFGGQYMTHYEAIRDAAGDVIGVLYVGINFTDSMRLLGDGIKSIKLGTTGGFYVLSARAGKDWGKAIVHRQLEGQNLLALQDQQGQAFVKTMLTEGKGVLRYTEANANGGAPREHIAAFTTIEDWQLLLVGDALLDEVTAGAARQRIHAVAMGVLLILVVTTLLYFIIRRLVAKPFGNALNAVEKVGGGDLTGTLVITSQDESGRLLASLQAMTAHLSSVVGEVRHGTVEIAAISAEVAAGNMELSARTEQQAAALEQTASSMEQMNASVRQNADHALGAQRLARTASDTARSGGTAVAQVVDKMDGIRLSSKRIADITSVVDGIAFQTNILALNAAVEAARAGEQGRGFAVVATEVRTLAQRSSAAAREIKQLIGESLDQVSEGAELAQRARATMQDVVAAIARTSATIDEISAATQEQAMGIDQINKAVVQLDQVTQQNAALVEEAAASAQTMKLQSEHLASVVQFFVIDQQAGPAAPKPRLASQRQLQLARA